jgi:hypothetical protein
MRTIEGRILSSQSIIINSEDSAFEYLEKSLKGNFDNKNVNFNFDGWPKLEINVKGDRYDSTVTASLMRSLIELQVHLNWAYGQIIYGKDGRSLTDEERASIEIVYKIEKGSSHVVADLSGFFTELGKSAVEKLTGKQIVTTVVGVAALWTAASSYSTFVESSQKELEENNRHEVTMKLIAKEPKMAEIQNEQVEKLLSIIKSVPDADQVSIGKTTLSKAQLFEINKLDRKKTEIKRIDGKYKIISLKNRDNDFRIEVERETDGETFSTTLTKGFISLDEMTSITKAFTLNTTISLNLIGRIRDDSIYSAQIIGVNHKANGEKVAMK